MEMSSELGVPATASDLPEISREELRRRLRDTSLIVVDVLSVESYAMGHIPGAINLPYESIASRARELLPNSLAEIVVYCGKYT